MYADVAYKQSSFDLTIVGQVKWCGSLERIPISLVRLLKNDLTINLIPTPGRFDLSEVLEEEQKILNGRDKTPGNVAILFDTLWEKGRVPAHYVPNQSFIKIAYSMIESTAIPKEWVALLNEKFDLVVVPDEFLVSIYQENGVQIPIFVTPHGIHLETLLNQPSCPDPSKPFIFGSSGVFMPRKNHTLLIEAFQAEFGNDPEVHLKIHGRGKFEFDLEKARLNIRSFAKNLGGSPNIELIEANFTHNEYTHFLQSLDCYVLLSKGEGFSLTPREALALGKPCIISDNTGHRTLAKTGYVYPIPSNTKEPAFYSYLGGQWGYNFNCSITDVRTALREVYTNYNLYKSKAEEGRKWVECYLWKNLKAKFLNLIKPTKVILGDKNEITNDFIITTSEKLFNKYQILCKKT